MLYLVGVDVTKPPEAGRGAKYHIAATDYGAKFVFARPLLSKTAIFVADFLYRYFRVVRVFRLHSPRQWE